MLPLDAPCRRRHARPACPELCAGPAVAQLHQTGDQHVLRWLRSLVVVVRLDPAVQWACGSRGRLIAQVVPPDHAGRLNGRQPPVAGLDVGNPALPVIVGSLMATPATIPAGLDDLPRGELHFLHHSVLMSVATDQKSPSIHSFTMASTWLSLSTPRHPQIIIAATSMDVLTYWAPQGW